MANIDGSVCLNHPDTPASFRCAVCGKPICSECAVKADGLTFCSRSCQADAQRTGAAVASTLESKNRAAKKSRVRTTVLLLIFLFIAVAVYWFYVNNKAKIDATVQQGIQQGEQIMKETQKSIEDNTVNRESQYKKDRENMVK